MNRSTSCPACGEEISVWQAVKAPMADRIRCPQCESTLQAKSWIVPAEIASLTVLAGLIGWSFLARNYAAFWFFIGYAYYMEWFFGLLLVNWGTFVTIGNRVRSAERFRLGIQN